VYILRLISCKEFLNVANEEKFTILRAKLLQTFATRSLKVFARVRAAVVNQQPIYRSQNVRPTLARFVGSFCIFGSPTDITQIMIHVTHRNSTHINMLERTKKLSAVTRHALILGSKGQMLGWVRVTIVCMSIRLHIVYS